MRTLEGKTALVTAGGTGIGRAIALALSARGVRVLVTGREERALGETVGEIAHGGGKGRHLAGDVRDPAHLAAAVGRAHEVFGGLDLVIANPAHPELGDLGGEPARAEAAFQANLMGAYYTFSAAVPRMKGPGRLVATSSALVVPGEPGYAASCAAHAGILALCRAVAHEVSGKKITCNAVVPGAAVREDTSREDGLEPEQVAELVVFLCSGAADRITGEAIAIGGVTRS